MSSTPTPRAYRLMTRTGLPIETKWEDGVYTLTMRFQGKK